MIKFKQGNIFDSEAKILVNPVNTDGVMGKGLAYQFKKNFPKNFENYYEKCKNKELDVGNKMIYTFEKEKIIVNFPTKKKWRENSKIEYIIVGLKMLKELMIEEDIKSIAIPPLGAGNGKLNWDLVKEKICEFANSFNENDYQITIYEPTLSEVHLNKSHLYLTILLLKINEDKKLKETITDLIFQKLVYMYDYYSNRDYFKYQKYEKGPFSKFLNIAYQELKNYSRTSKESLKDIEYQLKKQNISKDLENEEHFTNQVINFYKTLQKYYSTQNKNLIEEKIELLSTLIFILKTKKSLTLEELYKSLITWNKRKEKYSFSDVEKAIEFLIKERIVFNDIFGKLSIIKRSD